MLPARPASRFLSRHSSVTGTPGLLEGHSRNSKKPLWLAVMSADTVMLWPELYRRTITPRPYLVVVGGGKGEDKRVKNDDVKDKYDRTIENI